jgi:UDP-N-acetyl-D-galactosamine dehydrogenase
MVHGRKIAVIGLGYVGLPVAVAFARSGVPVVGFDIDRKRIDELARGFDRTREVEGGDLGLPTLQFTSDPAAMRSSDFYIVTVPTPIDEARQPDLGAMLAASRTVGGVLGRGDIVVFESTVYPGAVEEECAPVLEDVSGLKSGNDFFLGYSPERINPGDKTHRFESITKVVSGQDAKTLDVVAQVYGSVVTAGVHRAPSIRVAEAAKVIENTQRDLNIALMNEFATIFHRLDIDTMDVLEAARTKWNFLPFQPGLVGGHCIGVDPYYLTYRAQKAGHHPEVILSGRRINDGMGQYIAHECLRRLMRTKRHDPVVTVLGVTFKEDVPDIRNSKVVDVARELIALDLNVQIHDVIADSDEVQQEYDVSLTAYGDLRPADAVILAVAHRDYVEQGWPLITRLLKDSGGIVLDIKSRLDRATKPAGIDHWRL